MQPRTPVSAVPHAPKYMYSQEHYSGGKLWIATSLGNASHVVFDWLSIMGKLIREGAFQAC